ncbi:MAG: hypothetical protein IAG10_30700 [Planctomycetaceae bacterium]|nr:hypothetical protein [Planctomycetaceae bacterium]
MKLSSLTRWLPAAICVAGMVETLSAAESIWLEAEHLRGIKGYCWPMRQPAMKKTAGHWAFVGPGVGSGMESSGRERRPLDCDSGG